MILKFGLRGRPATAIESFWDASVQIRLTALLLQKVVRGRSVVTRGPEASLAAYTVPVRL